MLEQRTDFRVDLKNYALHDSEGNRIKNMGEYQDFKASQNVKVEDLPAFKEAEAERKEAMFPKQKTISEYTPNEQKDSGKILEYLEPQISKNVFPSSPLWMDCFNSLSQYISEYDLNMTEAQKIFDLVKDDFTKLPYLYIARTRTGGLDLNLRQH